MRIAVIPTIRDYPWGAPGHCMGELVRTLLEAGHEVLWFVAPIDWENAEVAQLRELGAKTVLLPGPPANYARFRRLRRWLANLRSSEKSLAEAIDQFGPDHIFVNQGGTWCATQDEFFTCLSSRPGRYSLICHLNEPQPAFGEKQFQRARELFLSAKRVFLPSQWVKALAETQIASPISNPAIFLYPMRFDFREPVPWPVSPEPRFAMVCRLDTNHKGIDCAFRALALLRAEGIKFSLRIYGSGPDAGYLSELARFLGIEDCVELCGYTNGLQEIWAREEILLLPSRREGSAVALTEAMGFGRPVIATAVGGAPEWIEDGVNGFICPAAEVELLVATLRRALAERSRWREMGLAAHHKIKSSYPSDPARVFLQSLS
ncbi:MAG: glycosyltransferase family 4 protein [Verrucomicrobiota bacterium]